MLRYSIDFTIVVSLKNIIYTKVPTTQMVGSDIYRRSHCRVLFNLGDIGVGRIGCYNVRIT